MKSYQFILLLVGFTMLFGCEEPDPNLNASGEDLLESKETFVEPTNLPYKDTVYVPIYSDIYSKTKEDRLLLTATLSIRNTSLTDSMYIRDIDYYDTDGKLVRHYIDKTLLLTPMQSIDYVIEEADTAGGTGANFIINWGANSNDIYPVFQGVMIAMRGQHGISFVTEGKSIKKGQ